MTHDKASSKNITHDVVSMCAQSNHNKNLQFGFELRITFYYLHLQ